MNTITYHLGDVRDIQATMPDNYVDFLCTSPPFLALRSYLPADHPDKHREIGSEPTPALFLDTMLGLTQEWRRIVTPTGSIAVEIGDTYSGSTTGGERHDGGQYGYWPNGGTKYNLDERPAKGSQGWPLAKSLCGIPTLYTWSLAYGCNLLNPAFTFDPWRIRNLLVWTRPNPPVGALGDKFRPATSYVTVACTSDRRWFDLDSVRTEHKADYGKESGRAATKRGDKTDGQWSTLGDWDSSTSAGAPPLDWWDDTEPPITYVTVACTSDKRWFDLDSVRTPVQHPNQSASGADRNGDKGYDRALGDYHASMSAGAPPLDWWEHDWQPLHNMPTAPYKGAHYATYPPTLPRRLIEAMCPREVCTVCGEPRRRIVDVSFTPHGERRDEAKGVRGFGVVNGEHAQHMTYGRATKNVDTVGWSDCECAIGELPDLREPWRPGIVLDPFAGSGTTALAAALCGRDAVLIDIDPRNIALARHRIGEHVQILSEQRTGDTVVWTVDHELPGLKHEHPDQMSLFQ